MCLAIHVGRRCKAIDVIDSIEELLRQYPDTAWKDDVPAAHQAATPNLAGVMPISGGED
jgi:hypothetical protein